MCEEIHHSAMCVPHLFFVFVFEEGKVEQVHRRRPLVWIGAKTAANEFPSPNVLHSIQSRGQNLRRHLSVNLGTSKDLRVGQGRYKSLQGLSHPVTLVPRANCVLAPSINNFWICSCPQSDSFPSSRKKNWLEGCT